MMKAVIMAGGKGTRIASAESGVPKPMIRIAGTPVLEHQIRCLRRQGIRELIFVVGYRFRVIVDYFGDGEKFGVHISYVTEREPLGTAGALYFLQGYTGGAQTLEEEDFLLLNGDLMFDVDMKRFLQFHRQKGGMATILTHPNSHPWDSALVEEAEDGCVSAWYGKEDRRGWYHNRVNAGIHMVSGKIFGWMRGRGMLQEVAALDLDGDVLSSLIPERLLYAYDSPEYVKDMGTPERLLAVSRDVIKGRVAAKNLSRPQRAVFLDRDGTINRYCGFLRNIDRFELLPGVAGAIKRLNEAGFLVIVVTNQPVIARGEVTLRQLEEIHCKMETLLAREGAYIDGLYFCPHHPDAGFAGEVSEYKIRCGCRKPEPGMLLKAAERYHIDLSVSWMVGDSASDMEAGRRAGCRCAGVGGMQGEDGAFEDLKAFCEYLLGEKSTDEKGM